MYVVASLLNPTATHQTQEIWRWLEEHCGLAGIKVTPLPHFSWQAAEEYDLERIEAAVRLLAEEEQPFTVNTNGLGIFTGDKPVLFNSLVKTRTLMDLQERIWQVANPSAIRPSAYYEPNSWVPHVTLAYRDINPDNLTCALQNLAFRKIAMEIRVDHLALIYEVDGEIGIKFRYDFGKK